MKSSSPKFWLPLMVVLGLFIALGALVYSGGNGGSTRGNSVPSPESTGTALPGDEVTPAPGAGAEVPRGVQHVFIISFDQMMPENVEVSEMPVLKKMAAEGAHTWEAYTIVPSTTLPSHVSMLTGVGIQKHQILWNDYLPEKGKLTVPTIFDIAKQHGLSTAIFAAKPKFQTFKTETAPDVLIIPDKAKAPMIAQTFAEEVGKLKPRLCFIHFGDPDAMGHMYGVRSPEKIKALAECDAALKVILDAITAAGLKESSVVIISADHGGHDRSAKENADRAARGESHQPGTHGAAQSSDVIIPWIAWGAGVKPGHVIESPVVTYDTAATALWLLDLPLPDSLWGRPVKDAFERL